jgi:hypothetical protein
MKPVVSDKILFDDEYKRYEYSMDGWMDAGWNCNWTRRVTLTGETESNSQNGDYSLWQ